MLKWLKTKGPLPNKTYLSFAPCQLVLELLERCGSRLALRTSRCSQFSVLRDLGMHLCIVSGESVGLRGTTLGWNWARSFVDMWSRWLNFFWNSMTSSVKWVYYSCLSSAVGLWRELTEKEQMNKQKDQLHRSPQYLLNLKSQSFLKEIKLDL